MKFFLCVFTMLSHRLFRQITDSLLLGFRVYPEATVCFASACLTCSSRTHIFAQSIRHSSSSSTRWKSRQGRDFFAKEARVQGLKSRAAFKLLEVGAHHGKDRAVTNISQLNDKHKLFRPGQTVVDLVGLPSTLSD